MKKIVFVAIVGYTGEVTNDNRVLIAPEADDCGRRPLRHRSFPLPVRAMVNGEVTQVGVIEMAALCDRRIIVFGHLDPREEFDWVRRGLDHEGYWLEIDVDDVKIEYSGDDTCRMSGWRLVGAMVGLRPCWPLPRTQIEIVNAKEEINA